MPETAKIPVDKVRELQRKLYVCAKRSRTRRFHALYDRIYRSDILREAWRRVRALDLRESGYAVPGKALPIVLNVSNSPTKYPMLLSL